MLLFTPFCHPLFFLPVNITCRNITGHMQNTMDDRREIQIGDYICYRLKANDNQDIWTSLCERHQKDGDMGGDSLIGIVFLSYSTISIPASNYAVEMELS